MDYDRRTFIKTTGAAAALNLIKSPLMATPALHKSPKQVTIANVDSNFEREPLIRPFGFKGG